ncbi:MAG: hypothetical protein V4478_01070 [Patescibacteria group bacterium]
MKINESLTVLREFSPCTNNKDSVIRILGNLTTSDGKGKIALSAETIGRSGLILPNTYSSEEIECAALVRDENNKSYLELAGKKYYYSLLKRISWSYPRVSYFLWDNGTTVGYYLDCYQTSKGRLLDADSALFEGVPSAVLNELLQQYPKLIPGSKPTLLHSLIPLSQAELCLESVSNNTHVYHSDARGHFTQGANAAKGMITQCMAILTS